MGYCRTVLVAATLAVISPGMEFCYSSDGSAGAIQDPLSEADLVFIAGKGLESLGDSLLGEERPEWVSRLNYGYSLREDLKPEFYFETVQPLLQDTESIQTVFLQPRISYNGTDHDVYNLGLGMRRFFAGYNLLLGASAFGDYQRDPGYGRAGVGGEILGPYWDARLNGYFRVGPPRQIESIDGGAIYEAAVNGMDGEIGGALPYFNFAKLYAGGRLYDLKRSENNLYGWWGRLELKPASYLVLNFYWSRDNNSQDEWRADARIGMAFEDLRFFPKFGLGEAYPRSDARTRSLDRVEREHRITRERYGKSNGIIFEIGRT